MRLAIGQDAATERSLPAGGGAGRLARALRRVEPARHVAVHAGGP